MFPSTTPITNRRPAYHDSMPTDGDILNELDRAMNLIIQSCSDRQSEIVPDSDFNDNNRYGLVRGPDVFNAPFFESLESDAYNDYSPNPLSQKSTAIADAIVSLQPYKTPSPSSHMTSHRRASYPAGLPNSMTNVISNTSRSKKSVDDLLITTATSLVDDLPLPVSAPVTSTTTTTTTTTTTSTTPTPASTTTPVAAPMANLKDGRKRRTSRACDRCNKLRTKCDGKSPCQHCVGLNLDCEYLRTPLPRGKASLKYLKGIKHTLVEAKVNANSTNTNMPKACVAKSTNNRVTKKTSNYSISTGRRASETLSDYSSSSSASLQELSENETNQKLIILSESDTITPLMTKPQTSLNNTKDSGLSSSLPSMSNSVESFQSSSSLESQEAEQQSPDLLFTNDGFGSPLIDQFNLESFVSSTHSSSSSSYPVKSQTITPFDNTHRNSILPDNNLNINSNNDESLFDNLGCHSITNQLSTTSLMEWFKAPHSPPSKTDHQSLSSSADMKIISSSFDKDNNNNNNGYFNTTNNGFLDNFPPSPPSGPDQDYKPFNMTSDENCFPSLVSDWDVESTANDDVDLLRSSLLINSQLS